MISIEQFLDKLKIGGFKRKYLDSSLKEYLTYF